MRFPVKRHTHVFCKNRKKVSFCVLKYVLLLFKFAFAFEGVMSEEKTESGSWFYNGLCTWLHIYRLLDWIMF